MERNAGDAGDAKFEKFMKTARMERLEKADAFVGAPVRKIDVMKWRGRVLRDILLPRTTNEMFLRHPPQPHWLRWLSETAEDVDQVNKRGAGGKRRKKNN